VNGRFRYKLDNHQIHQCGKNPAPKPSRQVFALEQPLQGTGLRLSPMISARCLEGEDAPPDKIRRKLEAAAASQ
jgi:hypothetical protein